MANREILELARSQLACVTKSMRGLDPAALENKAALRELLRIQALTSTVLGMVIGALRGAPASPQA